MRVDYNSETNREVAHTQLICIELNTACGSDSVNKHAEHRQPSILFLKKHPPTQKWPNIFTVVQARSDFILFSVLHPSYSLPNRPFTICHTHHLFSHMRKCADLHVMCVSPSQECVVFITSFSALQV